MSESREVAKFVAVIDAEVLINGGEQILRRQGLDHQIPLPGPEVNPPTGEIVCRERLGGVRKYYHRQAA